MRDSICFVLNGQARRVRGRDALNMLAPWLRQTQRLTGTKIACAHGACGSCSVLVGRPDGENGLHYQPMNACILPVFAVEGAHIITVEGLNGPAHVGGADSGAISPVQRALVECHGAQCGFCTPGIAVTLTAFHQGATLTSRDAAQSVLEGNLCRCTGYAPILDAALSVESAAVTPLNEFYPAAALPFAPAETVEIDVAADELEGAQTLFAPLALNEAVAWKAAHPGAVVVAGATEVGVKMSVEGWAPREILSLTRVADLEWVRAEAGELSLGARASWTRVKALAQTALPEFAELLGRWGSPQLRNAGTVAGNVMRAASNGDALPLFLVCEAQLELVGASGTRRVPVADWLRDRQSVKADEILARVVLPLPSAEQTLKLYKVSKRRAFDRSIVSAAFLLDARAGLIEEIKIACGGAAPNAMRLRQTEDFLRGKPLANASFAAAASIARAEVSPASDAAASAQYRVLLVGNLVRKFGREMVAARAEN